MPWRRIGVAIAVIVASLLALAGAAGFVVDWAWFSTIGYVGVFWTVFATKVVLFIAVFAVSSLAALGERSAGIAVCLAATTAAAGVLDPGFASVPGIARNAGRVVRASASPRCRGACSSWLSPWSLGLLIAIGETGQWDLILRFIYQVPYGQNDPLFGKDIGFYLFSLPVYIALKNWMLWILVLSAADGRGGVFRARRDRSGPSALAHFARRHRARLRAAGPLFRGEGLVLCAGPLPAAVRRQRRRGRGRLHRCPCRAARSLAADLRLPPPPPSSHGPTCGCAPTGLPSPRRCWCSAARSCSPSWSPGCSSASTSSRASCSWKRRTSSGTSPSPGKPTICGRSR